MKKKNPPSLNHNNLHTEDHLESKMTLKKLSYILIWSFFGAVFAAGVLSGSFGLGWQTDRFQSKFEPAVLKQFDKTHLVLDTNQMQQQSGGLLQIEWGTLLANAYVADALSTLTNEQGNDKQTFEAYRDFALYQFDKNFVETGYMQNVGEINTVYKLVKNINLYDFVNSVFKFDVAVGHKFIQPLVEPGLFWIMSNKGINHLLTPNWKNKSFYEFTTNLQTVYTGNKQTEFDNAMDDWFIKETVNNLDFRSWVDRAQPAENFNLINNKVWFVNKQFSILKDQISNEDGPTSVFSAANADWWNKNSDKVFHPIVPEQFPQPDYQAGYLQSRVGAIFIYGVIPAMLVICSSITLIIKYGLVEEITGNKYYLRLKSAKSKILTPESETKKASQPISSSGIKSKPSVIPTKKSFSKTKSWFNKK